VVESHVLPVTSDDVVKAQGRFFMSSFAADFMPVATDL
jgi:hypothetical protein